MNGRVRKQQQLPRDEPELKRLDAHVVTVYLRSGGRVVLRLDNNQVWEQTEAGPDLRIKAGDAIRIDKGVLGAYWLTDHSPQLAIKVRRTG